MKKIIFLNDWGEPIPELLSRYSNQTPDNSGEWGNIKGVSDINEADYYVIMDGTSSQLAQSLDWSRVIYFQREPFSVRSPFLDHDFPQNTLFKGTYEHFYNVPVWWINKSFNELEKLPYPTKTKKISSVTSGKKITREHSKRIDFLNEFIEEYPSIEVWGRGTGSVLRNPKAYKGEIETEKCKFNGLIDYEYSLVLENILDPNTWSEKPCDAFLCWSIPIYSGASNFGDFFPLDSFHQIDISSIDPSGPRPAGIMALELKKVITQIIEHISSPVSAKQIEALREARNDLLFKWNIWPTIDKIVKERS